MFLHRKNQLLNQLSFLCTASQLMKATILIIVTQVAERTRGYLIPQNNESCRYHRFLSTIAMGQLPLDAFNRKCGNDQNISLFCSLKHSLCGQILNIGVTKRLGNKEILVTTFVEMYLP